MSIPMSIPRSHRAKEAPMHIAVRRLAPFLVIVVCVAAGITAMTGPRAHAVPAE